MEIDVEPLPGVRGQFATTDSLTRLCLTNFHEMPARGVGSKVVIKRHDSVHFRASQIEFAGNDGDRALRNMPQFLLDGMQYGYQRTGPGLEFINDS
jgi:hypothetical protein